jgi:hypothetical protein
MPLHRIQPIVREMLSSIGIFKLLLIVSTGKTVEWSFSNEGFIPGCDYAGVVEEVGSNVTKVKKEDRVWHPLCTLSTILLFTNLHVFMSRLPVWSTEDHFAQGTAVMPNLFE